MNEPEISYRQKRGKEWDEPLRRTRRREFTTRLFLLPMEVFARIARVLGIGGPLRLKLPFPHAVQGYAMNWAGTEAMRLANQGAEQYQADYRAWRRIWTRGGYANLLGDTAISIDSSRVYSNS